MSWITVIWSMVASACLTLAGVHLLVWFQRRTQWAHLFFALAATATASMAFCEVAMFHADTVVQYGLIHRWVHVSYWVVIVSLVCYVRGYMGAGRLWLAWTVCCVRTLSLIINFASPVNLNFREITALRHVQLLGEPVDVAQGIPNPWIPVGIISLLLFLVFLADAALALWRRRERRSMLILISTMLIFIAASTGQVLLALWKIVVSPPTPSLFFLGVVAAMSWELSRETIRAEQLSEDLSKKEEWLNLAADSAGVGLWSYDVKTGSIWATERAMELYGFAPDESIDLDRFLTIVLEEDRERLVHIVEKSIRDNEELSVEYRIVLPDGSHRWLTARGCPQQNASGKTFGLIGAAIDISGRKEMEQRLRDSGEKLRGLTGRLFSAQEEERSRIARELHDDVTQRLAVLAIDMGRLELGATAEHQLIRERLHGMKTCLVMLSEDIHAISRQLHPSILDDLGLVRAIQSECAVFGKRKGIEVSFRHENVPEAIPADISLVLYRIMQESFTNIAKHSRAKSVRIFVYCTDDAIHLSINDAGVGFDPLKLQNKPGLGLVSMEERVRLVNGELSVDSVPGEGTTIDVRVPLEVRKHE